MGELTINKSLSITTANQEVSPERFGESELISISIVNTSTNGANLSVCFGEEAVDGKGIKFGKGGYYAESRDASWKVTQKQINIISDLAGATASVQLRILSGGLQ